MKNDLYDVLGVPKDVDSEALKKAYKQKALKLHPDKNPGQNELIRAQFDELQEAYQVLSDPDERAWYDSHRGLFLSDPEQADSVPVEISGIVASDILRYQSDEYFGILRESSTSFFEIFDSLFKNLVSDENSVRAAKSLASIRMPSFGDADTPGRGDVRNFYAAWSSFRTSKTFQREDIYNPSRATDRREKRFMEKENAKLRNIAAQEYNDAVLLLVRRLRKADPRLNVRQNIRHQYESMYASTRERSQKDRQDFLVNIGEAKQQDWTEPRPLKYTAFQEDFSGSSTDSDELLMCDLCRKTFRSEKQFRVHESSKKHKKACREFQKSSTKMRKNKEPKQSSADDSDFSVEYHSPVGQSSDSGNSAYCTADEGE